MVTEQIANLSTGNRRLGSSPSLSAKKASDDALAFLFQLGIEFSVARRIISPIFALAFSARGVA